MKNKDELAIESDDSILSDTDEGPQMKEALDFISSVRKETDYELEQRMVDLIEKADDFKRAGELKYAINIYKKIAIICQSVVDEDKISYYEGIAQEFLDFVQRLGDFSNSNIEENIMELSDKADNLISRQEFHLASNIFKDISKICDDIGDLQRKKHFMFLAEDILR